jgi:hypothetical protein
MPATFATQHFLVKRHEHGLVGGLDEVGHRAVAAL